jgi:hypothetical protein
MVGVNASVLASFIIDARCDAMPSDAMHDAFHCILSACVLTILTPSEQYQIEVPEAEVKERVKRRLWRARGGDT